MESALVLIVGFPGTGKLTVAQELVRQTTALGDEIRLVDNHSATDLLFPLIKESDGKSALPSGLIDRVREVNLSVLRTIEELSPTNWSFVFTHHLVDNDLNRTYLDRFEEVAAHRGSQYLPVVLSCEVEMLVERVVSPERRGRKLVDAQRAIEIVENGMLFPPGSLNIDVSDRSPGEAVRMILDHLD